jgi:hypothetical protein
VSSVWVSGPPPPEGEAWCTACVMLCKGMINEAHRAQGERIAADGKPNTHPVWIAPKETLPIQVAVVRALWDMMPQLGILDLCWTHVAGASWEHVSSLAVPPGLAPKGRG